MSRSHQGLLREALIHLDLAQQYAATDVGDQMVIDAVCMRLSAGIEVLARLEPEVLVGMFGESWPLMWGLRNRSAHGYLLVNSVIVRQTVETDLPGIIEAVRAELAAE